LLELSSRASRSSSASPTQEELVIILRSIETGDNKGETAMNDDEKMTPFIFREKDKNEDPTDDLKAVVVEVKCSVS
jgi:hypothetical protein